MENLRIRDLNKEDTEEIARIFSAIVQAPVEPDFKALIRAHARQEQDVCLVAELEGRVVGFLISYILTMGFGITKSAWIATLGVDPDYMGQGIGHALAHEILQLYKSQGIFNVYTSVRWDSPDLLSFFSTLGFSRSNFVNLRKVLD